MIFFLQSTTKCSTIDLPEIYDGRKRNRQKLERQPSAEGPHKRRNQFAGVQCPQARFSQFFWEIAGN